MKRLNYTRVGIAERGSEFSPIALCVASVIQIFYVTTIVDNEQLNLISLNRQPNRKVQSALKCCYVLPFFADQSIFFCVA